MRSHRYNYRVAVALQCTQLTGQASSGSNRLSFKPTASRRGENCKVFTKEYSLSQKSNGLVLMEEVTRTSRGSKAKTTLLLSGIQQISPNVMMYSAKILNHKCFWSQVIYLFQRTVWSCLLPPWQRVCAGACRLSMGRESFILPRNLGN